MQTSCLPGLRVAADGDAPIGGFAGRGWSPVIADGEAALRLKLHGK